jgi:hypothetical protein
MLIMRGNFVFTNNSAQRTRKSKEMSFKSEFVHKETNASMRTMKPIN